MFGNFFYYINANLGKFFFKNPNTLYYNLFNKLHQNFIAKKYFENEEIKQYIQKGFFKTKINSKKFCRYIASEIKKQSVSSKDYSYKFKINNLMKEQIKNHINIEYGPLLKNLEKFYNSRISVADIEIKRNFYVDENINKEVYSNYYHVDAYVYNHFKMFFNLMDIDIDHGPLHIYSKQDTKKFMKIKNYKNRGKYINQDLKECLITNTGKIGESFIANTTECLHKAGVVQKGKYRDILFITFITIPVSIGNNTNDFFYYEKKFPDAIWKGSKEIIKIAKPQSLRKTIKLFISYYKNKLN